MGVVICLLMSVVFRDVFAGQWPWFANEVQERSSVSDALTLCVDVSMP